MSRDEIDQMYHCGGCIFFENNHEIHCKKYKQKPSNTFECKEYAQKQVLILLDESRCASLRALAEKQNQSITQLVQSLVGSYIQNAKCGEMYDQIMVEKYKKQGFFLIASKDNESDQTSS